MKVNRPHSSTLSQSVTLTSKLFRVKNIIPLLFALFLSPVPKRLGFYEFIFSQSPQTAGMLPSSISSEDQWGFTFRDLYGDGEDADPSSQKAYKNRLWGQTALVTGANNGMGYEVSLALARLGVDVTMACRNPEKCKAAAKKIREDALVFERARDDREGKLPTVTTATVDVSSLNSVSDFSRGFQAGGTILDMVFFNAGVVAKKSLEDGSSQLSEDGIELIFATNVVGHHLMYKLLFENQEQKRKRKRKTPLRIVLTSSASSYDTQHDFKVPTDLQTLNGVPETGAMSLYAQSKLAQILWVQELTAQLDTKTTAHPDPNSIVYVNSAHPGAVATNIQYDGIDWEVLGRVAEVIFKAMRSVMWSAEEGALTLLYLGTALKDLQQESIRGGYFHPQSQRILDHIDASEKDPETKILREKLWKFLDELVADFV